MHITDAIGNTPLVKLRMSEGLANPVYAKCEHLNPGGSIKDRLALAIVVDAEKRGLLKPGMTIIEATAGNTGVGLALVAAARGYKLKCVMPEKMSVDKRVALRRLGAEVIISENAPPSDPRSFQNVARAMAESEGYVLADQFRNPANVRVHRETTAEEILRQHPQTIGAFVVGAGTGGTISGVGARLKEIYPNVRVVLADPIGSGLAHWVASRGELGPDGSYAVEGIGSSDPAANLHLDVIDEAESVSDEESFACSRRLAREEGLPVGGSAGTNVAAALRVAARDDIRGAVITVLPDGWDRYLAQPWMQEWTS